MKLWAAGAVDLCGEDCPADSGQVFLRTDEQVCAPTNMKLYSRGCSIALPDFHFVNPVYAEEVEEGKVKGDRIIYGRAILQSPRALTTATTLGSMISPTHRAAA
jgi:hypothetical protein